MAVAKARRSATGSTTRIYWLTVGPSGSSYSEIPFVYLYKLNIFTGRATRV